MSGNNGHINPIAPKRSTFDKNIQIVTKIGDANTATIIYNRKKYTVTREEKVFVFDPNTKTGEFVTCAPYDNFFVFLLPPKVLGWFAMCACGGPAVIVGSNAYKKDASPTDTGKMLICHFHATTGKHADGSS